MINAWQRRGNEKRKNSFAGEECGILNGSWTAVITASHHKLWVEPFRVLPGEYELMKLSISESRFLQTSGQLYETEIFD